MMGAGQAAWYLQWVGCALGVTGSLLLALNKPFSGWGFIAFLASNACWIGFALLTNAPGLFYMQVAFTATSLLGVYRWIVLRPSADQNSGIRLKAAIYNPREFRARKSGEGL